MTILVVKQFCETKFSVESIVQHLSQFGEPSSALSDEKATTEPKILRRVSSSHDVLRHLRNVSLVTDDDDDVVIQIRETKRFNVQH